jgi:hypothetical protein
LKTANRKHKIIFCLLATLIFSSSVWDPSQQVFGQFTTIESPEFFMGIQILESDQKAILGSIEKVKELQLGNMIILHPMDQSWNLTLVEEAIRKADSLGLYTIFEAFNFSDHAIRISPELFSEWQLKYPHLYAILVQEVTGKQVDLQLWENNSTGLIKTKLQAEQAIIQNITSSMKLEEFKNYGAKILLQENVVSYASANTSYCDVLITKVFNAPNTELMIGLTRGMARSYNIPAWGLWVDTWREWEKPPAFTPNDVERALYESWFYGAKYFFFEQGNFFGSFNRDWDNKYIILREDGKLTDYGKVLQSFFIFLQNQNSLRHKQPNYESSIAVMIGQSGWASRGKDWGLWEQSDRQADFDYNLLNLFFPGIGDNWQIGHALTGKEFTGLPFGMVDIISIYSPAEVMKKYKVVIGLGWSQMNDAIVANIEEYVDDGGVFFSLLTFTHSNPIIDDLENPYAWMNDFASLFGVKVMSPSESRLDIQTDVDLLEITFTQDTFWHPWNGQTYSYGNVNGTGSWFWKYKYIQTYNENTTVLAWVNNIQTEHNAFIIEHKKGAGYTYIVNTRNPNSLPDGVLTNVLSNFIYYLCAHYVKPMTFIVYPKTEYWLCQGQTEQAIYLMHDNSTTTQQFKYFVDSLESHFDVPKKYVIFEFLGKDYYGVSEDSIISLDVTLDTNEAKVFLLLEDNNEPQVLYSDSIIDQLPLFENQRLIVSLSTVLGATNTTQIYCSKFETPKYILGAPYNILKDYNKENKILTINSNSDIILDWKNTTEVMIVESTATLTEALWNSTLETLTASAKGTTGQQFTINLQTKGKKPYYIKIDGTETNDWSYDANTDLLSANFFFSSETAELVFGFKSTIIDNIFVSDQRADLGSVQKVGFHVSQMSNGSDVKGASVHINGTKHVTNATGWASFDVSCDIIGKTVWNVTDFEFDGLSLYAKTTVDPFIIWDRINVTDMAIVNGVVPTGTVQTLWLTAEYEYDSKTFDETKGTMYLNGKKMIWSNQNKRWEQTVTSNVLGPIGYEASTVDDKTVGLTSINKNGMVTTIMWDRIALAKIEFDSMAIGEMISRSYIEFSYSKTPISNATVFVNGKTCTETEKGIYACTLDGFGPFERFIIEADFANFEKATVSVTSIQFSNTLVYTLIGTAVLLIVIFLRVKIKKKKIKID